MNLDVSKVSTLVYFTNNEIKKFHSSEYSPVDLMKKKIQSRLLEEPKYDHISQALQRLPLCIRIKTSGPKNFQKHNYATVIDIVGYQSTDKKSLRTGVLLLDMQNLQYPKLRIIITEWQTISFDISKESAISRFLGQELVNALCTSLQQKSFLENDHKEKESNKQVKRWIYEVKENILSLRIGSVIHNQTPLVGSVHLDTIPVFVKNVHELSLSIVVLPRGPKKHTQSQTPTLFLQENSLLHKWYQKNLIPPQNDELLGLLHMAYCPNIDMRRNFAHQKITDNFSVFSLVPLIAWLNESLNEIKRTYVRQSIASKSPSGTIDFGQYVKNISRGKVDVVPLQKFVYSYDTLVNRVLKGVAQHCSKICNQENSLLFNDFSRQLTEIVAKFPQTKLIYPTTSHCDLALKETSSTTIQHTLLLCKDFLSGKYITLDFWGDQHRHTQNFEINMNSLFENATRQFFQLCLPQNTVLDGNDEQPTHTIRWTHHNFSKTDLYPLLKPDFLAVSKNKVIALGDAKYKLLNREHFPWDNSSLRPLLRDDFYQMVGYMTAWPTSLFGVVLFPEANLNREGRTVSQLISVLSIQNREIGIFSIQASLFSKKILSKEPLYQWLQQKLFVL